MLSKKRFYLVMLVTALLMMISPLAGCGRKQKGLLSEKEIQRYVSMVGLGPEEVKKKLKLSDDAVGEPLHRGLYPTTVTRAFSEREFRLELLFDTRDEPFFYGCQYVLEVPAEEGEELMELMVSTAQQAKELYGEPSTYPGHPDRFFHKDGSVKDGGGTYETWDFAGDFQFEMRMYDRYEGTGCPAAVLRYRVRNPMISRNESYPKRVLE